MWPPCPLPRPLSHKWERKEKPSSRRPEREEVSLSCLWKRSVCDFFHPPHVVCGCRALSLSRMRERVARRAGRGSGVSYAASHLNRFNQHSSLSGPYPSISSGQIGRIDWKDLVQISVFLIINCLTTLFLLASFDILPSTGSGQARIGKPFFGQVFFD